MSAFMVSKAHIDALVTVALEGPRPVQGLPVHWHALSWYAKPVDVTTTLEQAQRLHREAQTLGGTALGRMLVAANHLSLVVRYGEDETPPRYIFCAPLSLATRPTAVEALKLIACFDYQCCESATWRTSEARLFCDALQEALIRVLPGYDQATWEWGY